MGGVEKGLLTLHGEPLARRALRRLAPQVTGCAISANRERERYAAWGVPVWPDAPFASGPDDRREERQDAWQDAGPLLGLLTALRRCPTPWLACVPCDLPHLPQDLVARLAAALPAVDNGTDRAEASGMTEIETEIETAIAMAATGAGATRRVHPLCALVPRSLADDLAQALRDGERRVRGWMARHRCIEVTFDDAAAFANVNTPQDLARLEAGG